MPQPEKPSLRMSISEMEAMTGHTYNVYNSIVDGFNDVWFEQMDFMRPGRS